MLKSPILYVLLAVIIGLSTTVTIYHFKNKKLEEEKTELMARVAKQESLIELRNQEVEKNKLEIEEYKNRKPEIKEKIITRYKTVKVETKTCETELGSVKDLLEVFNDRD